MLTGAGLFPGRRCGTIEYQRPVPGGGVRAVSPYRKSDGDIFYVWPALQASCLGQQHLSFIGFERVALHMYWHLN